VPYLPFWQALPVRTVSDILYECGWEAALDVNKQTLTQRKSARPETQLSKLAKTLGSAQALDPIPPSQYLFFLDKSQPALQRLLAWVRSKTIRFRPQKDGSDGRSPHCIDQFGKPLGLADMARDLDWTLPNASREWKKAEQLGLVRKDAKKLILVGQVRTLPQAKTRQNVICTDNLPLELIKVIKTWPKARQREFHDVWEPAVKLGLAIQAAKVAEARITTAEVEDTILSHFGLERKHLPRRSELKLPELPPQLRHFVQITSNGAVQITTKTIRTDNVFAASTDNQVLIDQRNPRVSTVEPSSSVEVAELAALLALDDDAASRLWQDCRKTNPEISVDEIAILARMKWKQVGSRIQNWVGLTLKAVPPMCRGKLYEHARYEAQRERDIQARLAADLQEVEKLMAEEATPGEPAPDSDTSQP
jgi:hypothetical protein